MSDLRYCSIVPDVAFVGENIGDVTQVPLLHILLDRVQWFLGVDLKERCTINNLNLGQQFTVLKSDIKATDVRNQSVFQMI